jgi:hypothetical protein
MPLQAADLSWHIRKHFESGDPDVPGSCHASANGMHSASDTRVVSVRAAEQFSNVPGASTLSGKKEWKKYRNEARQLECPLFRLRGPCRENAIDRFGISQTIADCPAVSRTATVLSGLSSVLPWALISAISLSVLN